MSVLAFAISTETTNLHQVDKHMILSSSESSIGGRINRFSGSSLSVTVVRQNGFKLKAGRFFPWQDWTVLTVKSLIRAPKCRRARMSVKATSSRQHRDPRGPQTRTPRQGTGLGRPGGRTGDPAKKNEWGFVGPITGLWLKEQTKLEILTVIATSQQQGVSARRSCSLLAIEHRRVVRWQRQSRLGQPLANLSPGPQDPLHRVLPAEIDQIVLLAQSQEYVDLSHRILAVTAWDQGLFHASFSTVYRVLKERNLMTDRGSSRPHNGHSKPPVRKDLTGPNQRWCWDISYLPTFQKGEYLFLYLLLDEWSRKAIQWRIAWHQTAEESRRLLEGGLRDQNILDLPEDQRPEIFNDWGPPDESQAHPAAV